MTRQPQLDRMGMDIRDPWACPLPKRRVQLDRDLKEFARVRREVLDALYFRVLLRALH